MTYVTYECTICRRTKSFIKDNQRVQPDQCVITKGCLGRLIPVGETKELTNTPSISNVQDWYARGIVHDTVADVTPPVADFALSTSAVGSLVIAVASTSPSTLPSQLHLSIEQKRVGDVGFQQFIFKIAGNMNTNSSTIVSGKDLNGRNLRFDQEAIDEGRVAVRVNGVLTPVDLTPSKLVFSQTLAIGSTVDVIVYLEKSTMQKMLTFTRNKSLIPSLTRGAWSNIDFVQSMTDGSGTMKWYLYSADDLGTLTTGKIRIIGNDVSDDALFLLASTPFQSADRYLNFVVSQKSLATDFNLAHSSGELTASTALLMEIFPPFELVADAYISADLYTVDQTSAIVTDTELSRFASKKILGPV